MTEEWKTLGDRAKWARKRAKLTQKQVEKAAGLSQSVISDIETKSARTGSLASLAHLYRVNALWLETGRGLPGDPNTRSARRNEEADAAADVIRVPVVGEARLGDGGFFEERSFDGSDGYVLFPGDPDSVALRCKGDSMRPSIKPGDFVVISPRSKIEVGDVVACQTQDGRRMIKILNRRFDGTIELTSINEDFRPVTLDADEVAHLYRAVGPIPASYYHPDSE